MKIHKFIEVSLLLTMLTGLKPAIANSQEVNSSKPSNQMLELSESWGFDVVDCQGEVAEISHDITKEKVCIAPNEKIGAGKYIYDSANNKIRLESPPPSQPK